MKLTKVTIDGLFGMFRHEIDINTTDNITIIHGENGIGKTCILRLINAFFNNRYLELRKARFNELIFMFDTGDRILITQSEKINKSVRYPKSEPRIDLLVERTRPDGTIESASIGSSKNDNIMSMAHEIESASPYLVQVAANLWRDLRTEEILTAEEVVERNSEMLLVRRPRAVIHEWLLEITGGIDVLLIETQRLLNTQVRDPRKPIPDNHVPLAVTMYAKDIASKVQFSLAQYAERSQSLDRTFLSRVVSLIGRDPLPEDELQRRLSKIAKQRYEFEIVGVLDQEVDPPINMGDFLNETMKIVLRVYVEDSEAKLQTLEEIAQKITVLKAMVDDHFLYKQMRLDREIGFVFRSDIGELISPDQLSSGEQNELVLFYEMLFKVRRNSLILIDEPEISLHIRWQQQFLKDLGRAMELSSLSAIVATHSPEIISDRWDLTVELFGPVSLQ